MLLSLLTLLLSHAIAQPNFEPTFEEAFQRGTPPTAAQMQMRWQCVYADSDRASGMGCGSDYGLSYENGRFVAKYFGLTKNPVNVATRNNALVFTQAGTESTVHLSVRAVQSPNGPRLILEESDSLLRNQTAKKSAVTGYTPRLYSACVPADEIVNSFRGTQANPGTSTPPATTR